jgi:glycine amidinotransferase
LTAPALVCPVDAEAWIADHLCDLLHYAPFGGSFHCATLDIRRRGTLESYFD